MREPGILLERIRQAISPKYGIERELGRGGMATVFLARDVAHNRPVAIKVLHSELGTGFSTERFLREIRLLAALQHPNILPLYDSGEFEGVPYFVMPFVSGESLRDRLKRDGKLPAPLAIRMICEAANALDYAHRQGVIHRDIKPENILLSDEHVIIADFGIARAAAQSAGDELTGTAMTLGTPAYMSPEQASADKNIDGRSDIYSLACVLFEALSGTPPFTGPNPAAIMASRFVRPAPRISTIMPGISPAVDATLASALSLSRDDRPQSASQFGEMLTAETTRAIAPGDHRRFPLMVGVGATLVIVGALGFAAMRMKDARTPATPAIPAGQSHHIPKHVVSEAALDLYEQGRIIYGAPSADGITKAASFFQAAIDRDSLYAEAWAGLADSYSSKGVGNYVSVPPRPEFQRARVAATRALELDSTLAEAHASLALVEMMYDYDWGGASQSLDRAQSYDPGYENTYVYRSFLLSWLGKFDSATAVSREAAHINPADLRIRLEVGRTLIQSHHFAEAERELRADTKVDSTNVRVRTMLGEALVAEGRIPEALKQLETAQKISPASSRVTAFRVAGYSAAGRHREAQAAFDSLLALSDRSFVPAMDIAIGWAGLGRRDEALTNLENAYTDRTLRPLLRNPVFDFLKSEPRYRALLKKMNLAELAP
jgi:tetratricopeptide (TPR) repeat protein/tRNA A-37 threonylcarbamoyl transferase component Bud32